MECCSIFARALGLRDGSVEAELASIAGMMEAEPPGDAVTDGNAVTAFRTCAQGTFRSIGRRAATPFSVLRRRSHPTSPRTQAHSVASSSPLPDVKAHEDDLQELLRLFLEMSADWDGRKEKLALLHRKMDDMVGHARGDQELLPLCRGDFPQSVIGCLFKRKIVERCSEVSACSFRTYDDAVKTTKAKNPDLFCELTGHIIKFAEEACTVDEKRLEGHAEVPPLSADFPGGQEVVVVLEKNWDAMLESLKRTCRHYWTKYCMISLARACFREQDTGVFKRLRSGTCGTTLSEGMERLCLYRAETADAAFGVLQKRKYKRIYAWRESQFEGRPWCANMGFFSRDMWLLYNYWDNNKKTPTADDQPRGLRNMGFTRSTRVAVSPWMERSKPGRCIERIVDHCKAVALNRPDFTDIEEEKRELKSVALPGFSPVTEELEKFKRDLHAELTDASKAVRVRHLRFLHGACVDVFTELGERYPKFPHLLYSKGDSRQEILAPRRLEGNPRWLECRSDTTWAVATMFKMVGMISASFTSKEFPMLYDGSEFTTTVRQAIREALRESKAAHVAAEVPRPPAPVSPQMRRETFPPKRLVAPE